MAELQTPDDLIVPEIVALILAGRGMAPEQMAAFLYPDYTRDAGDPMLLTDMEKAVDRITRAAGAGERVVVYGDYDIDGITASAVLIEGLRALGIEAESYIPDRFEEGYGINQGALAQLKERGVDLVISVDCGITSVDEAAWAREHGLDLVITDHHAVPEVLPEAVAVINPKRPGDAYPFKELAGVGVAFKLVQALQAATDKPAAGQEKWLLDLVALGTICDVVPLVGENRMLASYGLRVLRRTRRVGLRALAEVGGVNIGRITAYDVGFVLGPRMNAAGRLEHAAQSVELVMTSDPVRARTIAQELDNLNHQRRSEQARILAAAEMRAAEFEADPVLVLADPDWSHGIVGIVASKLAEKLGKPVLLAQDLGEHIKGSARSIPGFNMVEALRSQAELLSRFGGHFFAAGYTFPAGNLEALRTGLNDWHRISMDGAGQTVNRLEAELAWPDLAPVDEALVETFELMEPFGNSNPRPVVGLGGLHVASVRPVGSDGKHLSLKLGDAGGRTLSVIGFGLAQRYDKLRVNQTVSVRGYLNKNEFQGKTSVQMVLSELDYE
ncbi:MAG TPA: single-stranded-DNA-specific exonuclease RecJ [Candidatus Saccharimonadia bacterium]|jgi:single-stranded-DNA-specific exonuclease|nr:single-stranded-DNA-specific exonuclease RecJ [Candidatus Saccharimonadia bacterium]